ncbi:MAG TPA: DUF4157 domain-containing protein [Pyrinomonadaceae bacterium]|jgi:hypothetical protein
MNARTQARQSNAGAAPPETTRAQMPLSRMTRPLLQRSCACGDRAGASGECADCTGGKAELSRAADARGSSPSVAPTLVHEALGESGSPLDASTRAFMEPRFGHDFARVRIHSGGRAAASARAVGASAYTVGRDVVFGEGQYEPGTARGRRLLAHELTHVVQQRDATPHAGLQARALEVGRSHTPAEREADAVAERVLAGEGAGPISGAPSASVQRQGEGEGGAGGGGGSGGGKGSGGGGGGSPAPPPHISTIHVDMNTPQNVTLDWSDGTNTAGIQCSTGRGKTCPRPCDPPRNAVNGSNCTPDGTFTVDAKYRRTGGGLNYFVSFVAARSIGLHEYSPVDGTPLSHGCVRLHTADAQTVYNGSVPNTTQVAVTGLAIPSAQTCPPATGGTGHRSSLDGGDAGESALAQNEAPGSTDETDPGMS